jgi:glycosyltransferase involved in cell wall biosynthesis
MTFSLIICTYKRAQPLLALLQTIAEQSLGPHDILIIDGSPDEETKIMCHEHTFKNLKYFQVQPHQKGLTKQRNFGLEQVMATSEIICFLDDDTLLMPNYFEEIIKTYLLYPEALGVGGYINNDDPWFAYEQGYIADKHHFCFDGYYKSDGSRFVLRKKFNLDSDKPPGFLPEFSHGRSISFLPPSGKIYEVEQFMGGVSSFRKEIFKNLQFSTYFEGYGLYEDADFTLRLSKLGKLYVNTAAQLEHHHDPSGRPNMFKYGKMVVRNGWYVWRVKWPNPSIKAQFKWHSITLLLAFIRLINVFTTDKKLNAAQEFCGRFAGWVTLIFNKPQMN